MARTVTSESLRILMTTRALLTTDRKVVAEIVFRLFGIVVNTE